MATTNDSQLTAFLKYFNTTAITSNFTPAQKATGLMKFFVSANTQNPNPPPGVFPCLGITDHGPAFNGVTDVTTFFTQLFTSFPDMRWYWPPPSAPNAPRLTATNEIGVQMTVTGTYQAQWFQAPGQGQPNHFSQPLSQLPKNTVGSPLGARKGDNSGLPAFAVFTFDGSASCLIDQLQIYLDRYAMMQTIAIGWVPDPDSVSAAASVTNVVRAGRGRGITISIED
jgi:hypothetical protein